MAVKTSSFQLCLARAADEHKALQDAFSALQKEHAKLNEEHSEMQQRFTAHLISKADSAREIYDLQTVEETDAPPEGDDACEWRSVGASECSSVANHRSSMEQSLWKNTNNKRLRQLCSQRLNMQRQRLQTLLADLDPDEQSHWMSHVLSAEDCLEILHAQGHFSHDLDFVQDILSKLVRLSPDTQEISREFIVDLTSMTQLEHALDTESFECALLLRDAVIWDVSNKLLNDEQQVEVRLTALSDVALTYIADALNYGSRSSNSPLLHVFDGAMTLLVIANIVIIGVSTDVMPAWEGWDIISAGFAAFYVLEVILKMSIMGTRQYLCGKDNVWNIFDIGLAMIALIDVAALVVRAVGSNEFDTGSLSLMRLVRLSRLTRIARLARLAVFQELSHMLRGIAAGTRTLLWALILTMSVSYVGGVLLTETIGRAKVDDDFSKYRTQHFSTVVQSMFTVFRCFTGDCTTYDGKPLPMAMHGVYGSSVIILYSSLIMLVNLGLFNVIISIFVQNTQRASKFSDDERRKYLAKHRKLVATKTQIFIRRVWELYRKSKAGRVSLREKTPDLSSLQISRAMFAEMMKDDEVNDVLDDLGLEETNRMTLFDLLDVNSNGKLMFTDLVQSIVRIGKSRQQGVEELNLMMKAVHHRLLDLEGCLIYRQSVQNDQDASLHHNANAPEERPIRGSAASCAPGAVLL